MEPSLALVEVTASLYQGEELLAEMALLELSSWALMDGQFTAELPLPADLPTGEYTVVITASDEVRSAASEPQTFVYRALLLPQISLESPVAGRTYYSAVSIAGNFSVDPALVPELHAVLQSTEGDDSQALPLIMEGQTFSGVVDEPGAYHLVVTLTDGHTQVQQAVDFDVVEPYAEALIDHDYSQDEYGLFETTGDFRFIARLETNFPPQPQSFMLEHEVSGVWFALAEFAAEDVWSEEEQMAAIVYDFRDSSYGFYDYRVRLRAELQEGVTAISERLSLRYQAVPPTLAVTSPVGGQTYYRDVVISGVVTWDEALSATVSAVLEGEGDTSIPLEVADGSFRGTIPADIMSSGTHSVRIWVQDSHANYVEENITFRYQAPVLTAAFSAPVTGGAFEILQPVIDLAGHVSASAAFPLEKVSLLLQSVDSTEAPLEIPLFKNGDPQSDDWNVQTGEFTLRLQLAQYELGPGTYDLIILAQDSFPQQVESDPIRLQYRQPDTLGLALSAPTDALYFAPVQIAGSVYWDAALELDLRAVLEDLDGEVPAQPLELARNGNSFSAIVTEPGQYRLTVTATDSVQEVSSSVEFLYVEPELGVDVRYEHPVYESGLVDLVGPLALSVEVANEYGVPLTGFGLEAFLDESWMSVGDYSSEEVWDEEAFSAQLTFDFMEQDLPFGVYQLRVRVDYQGDRFVYSDVLEVDYHQAITQPEYSLRLTSPESRNRYSGSVPIAGVYSIDPALAPFSLDIIDAAGAPLPIAIDIDPQSPGGEFTLAADCQVLSPGIHQIQARLRTSDSVLLSEPVAFEFNLPKPQVELDILNRDREVIYFYGSADFGDCALAAEQLPPVAVFVNESPIKVQVDSGQLPGDFVFGVNARELPPGSNVIRVEVVDPRDPQAVGAATATVSDEPGFSVTIENPKMDSTLTGQVQVYGYFTGARGPLSLYSEINGEMLIEYIPVSGNQTFSFTIPAKFLHAEDYHVLYLRAYDQGTQQQAETKVQFAYKPGGELTVGGDVLVVNDVDDLWQKENQSWLLSWMDFESDIVDERRNSVRLVLPEASCQLADSRENPCETAEKALGELYTEYGYPFVVAERASLVEIPADTKVLILFLPDRAFNEKETLALKNFAGAGGRVVYIGASDSCSDCYFEPTQAQLLQ